MKSALLLICLSVWTIHAQERSALALAKVIPLPGVQGRFDHFALDEEQHRLFMAALGNNSVEVVDLIAGRRIKSVSGMSRPTGLAYLPGPNQLWVANGGDGALKILDGSNFSVIRTIPGLDDADNLRLDPKAKQGWLGYANGALALLDTDESTKIVASIILPAHPESFQIEQRGGRIFVNLPEAKQIAVIDRRNLRAIASWPMDRFRANFPMALDEAHRRLFVGCRDPARLVVLDTTTGKLVADLAISGDTDDLFHDAVRSQLYLSCGEGFINVVTQISPDQYRMKEKIQTRAGARTGFFSPSLGQFYLGVPQQDGREAELRIFTPQE